MKTPDISLSEALKTGKINQFIHQQERWEKDNNFGPGVDKAELDRELEALITAPPPEDQT